MSADDDTKQTEDQIARYGADVWKQIDAWWAGMQDHTMSKVLKTYYGDTPAHPDIFEQACTQSGYPLTLRRHAGYDHGYYFIATFMADHLRHHARQLGLPVAG